MNYPENIEKKLDMNVLRERLSRYCSSSLGREQVDAMSFLTDYDTINHLLQETQEMLHVREDASLAFPRGNINDLRENLARIRIEGLFLDEEELHQLRQTIGYAIELEQFFSHLDSTRFPLLSTLTIASTPVLPPLKTRIDKIIDPFGQMRDNASPELARIRRELNQAQGSVSRTINGILRKAQSEGLIDKDATPTLREGRLVLPIPPGIKKKIGGIVHDESATGKTVYIEPAEVVEANNRIRSLEGEEKRERARILIELTNQIRPFIPAILQTESYLAHIDFLGAKAELGRALHAIAPEMQDAPVINVRGARHPVLYLRFIEEGREVVPLSLRLGESGTPPVPLNKGEDSKGGDEAGNRILVISGPNAGGKSVCLKTVGLIQYMLQCGLLVPVEENSVLGIFQQILLDIGDEQSIADDLSTYSSHLRNMKYFVQHADHHTLFLIDEFGSGTEPAIGGALAEALLSDFNNQQAIGIVTTHYTNLKHLAEQTEGLINGAMLYDRGALKPLFQLSVGQAGSSFAIEIARQTGLPERIVQQAIDLVGTEHIDYDKQLQDIARDKRYWENKRQNIRQKEKHLEEKITFYEQEIAGLKAKKREIIAEAKEEAQNLLQQSNATIERTIREIKESKADKERTRKARGKVESMKAKVGTPPSPLSKGNVKGKKDAVLHDFRDLKGISKSLPSSQPSVVNTIRRAKLAFQRELDMRGLRIDEAQEQLIAYMDSAIMVNAGEISILHGTGTGALKQLTRDYLQRLKKQNRIQDFYEGDVNHGGAGFTIVEI
ncbi:MAG: Smr/MutS family protein [Paludibacteraceae bacterium]|nr:Smr/MutS family protein [Paludibacteraceae bacterium]